MINRKIFGTAKYATTKTIRLPLKPSNLTASMDSSEMKLVEKLIIDDSANL
jgi:hypothetical protein